LTFAPETNKYALDPNDKAAMDEALAAANDTAISEWGVMQRDEDEA